MYFLLIAPQRKKQKEHEKMLAALKTGRRGRDDRRHLRHHHQREGRPLRRAHRRQHQGRGRQGLRQPSSKKADEKEVTRAPCPRFCCPPATRGAGGAAVPLLTKHTHAQTQPLEARAELRHRPLGGLRNCSPSRPAVRRLRQGHATAKPAEFANCSTRRPRRKKAGAAPSEYVALKQIGEGAQARPGAVLPDIRLESTLKNIEKRNDILLNELLRRSKGRLQLGLDLGRRLRHARGGPECRRPRGQ
jgi:hypothetical protein